MKTLIIYISATGNTKRLASEIANKLGGVDLLPIKLETTIPISNFWAMLRFKFLMSLKRGFKYNMSSENINAYDQIIVGSPVWIGRAAPPIIDVVNKYEISQKVKGVFVTCGSGPGNVFEDILKRTQVENLKNRLVLSDKDSYDNPFIQDKIEDFVNGLKTATASVANASHRKHGVRS